MFVLDTTATYYAEHPEEHTDARVLRAIEDYCQWVGARRPAAPIPVIEVFTGRGDDPALSPGMSQTDFDASIARLIAKGMLREFVVEESEETK